MGFIVKAVKSVVKAVVGVVSKVVGGVFGFLVGGGKSTKATAVNNLNKTLDPEAFRKIVFGRFAMPLDQRYWEVYGAKGTLFDEVLAVASHQINSFQETYFEDELGFNAAGAPQGKYVGAVTRQVRLGTVGQTALPAGAGQYSAAATFDGCACILYKWIPDEKKLPNGIPSRYTQVGEGALVYDPRRDSTVAGGSGTHRIDDQTTWAYATLDGNGVPIGRNNALQVLWYLIGWRIAEKDGTGTLTGDMTLVLGRGIEPEDINLSTFIAAANACEAAGYYTDMALTAEDNHTTNEGKLTCDGLIGQLIDPGGLWSYYANVDDTANIAVELTDADILDQSVSWQEFLGMNDQYTGVAGKYINPSAAVLFQEFPYPMVRDATYEANLGTKRRKTQDFEQVCDDVLAQRLARLLLNQGQYQGQFGATFNFKAIKAQAWSVVRLTSERFDFDYLFRVYRHDISTEEGIAMTLKQIDASIWSAGTVNPPVAPGAGLKYDASQEVAATGVAVAQFAMVGGGGTLADGFQISWTAPPTNVRRTEVRYRLVGTVPWLTAGPVAADVISVIVGPLFSGAIYEAGVRHISIHEVPGAWIAPAGGAFALGTTGNVNYAAIAAAGGTANWSTIVDDNGHQPDNDADVTLVHVSSGFTGQAPIATDTTAQIGATVGATIGTNLKEGATVLISQQVRNGSLEGGVVSIIKPIGGNAQVNGPVTGAIKIVLPQSFTYTMMQFQVDIYNYNTGQTVSYLIAGYAEASVPTWVNVTAKYIGPENYSFPVYFGRETGTNKCVIWIGDTTSPWSYPQISVRNFQAGYIPLTVADWETGWNVSVSAAARTNVTASVAKPVAGDSVFGENVKEISGGALASLSNFKTILGVASGISGQGALATASVVAWTTQVTGTGKPDDNADVTASSQIGTANATQVNIPADYTGTIAGGVLPVTVTPVVTKGGVDKRTDNGTSYAVSNLSGGCVGNVTVNNTNGSADKGRQTIGTSYNATGAYDLVITVGGVAQPTIHVTVTKVLGDAPSGGSGGTKTGSFDATGTLLGNSLAEIARISNLTKATGETIRAFFSSDYSLGGISTGSKAAVVKWQYSIAGANSWTDFSSAVTGSASTWDASTFSGTQGSVTCNQTVAPSNGIYDVRLVGAKDVSGGGGLTMDTGPGSIAIAV